MENKLKVLNISGNARRSTVSEYLIVYIAEIRGREGNIQPERRDERQTWLPPPPARHPTRQVGGKLGVAASAPMPPKSSSQSVPGADTRLNKSYPSKFARRCAHNKISPPNFIDSALRFISSTSALI
ncbi:Hypothetical protein NTJ_09041 [Nesidiocoris tenuis]|uniref:Uncharacterized protein n=1 Tax=Nesidiocoris tenuis TaxID=355587 RepID=A0ABN7B0H8_9HEMI|nr:Hypothetical protein NTJ_09041 [Nesidiocoris tenuis]